MKVTEVKTFAVTFATEVKLPKNQKVDPNQPARQQVQRVVVAAGLTEAVEVVGKMFPGAVPVAVQFAGEALVDADHVKDLAYPGLKLAPEGAANIE